ncbi:MAG: FAD-dependent monooxygenase, partial [Pseudomonadota bacterium]|nr:FAD-dependent monooxygenase [Pseudomonadota bacterium]
MQHSDVIILGGGLVGLALAAALDSSGLSSTVVDPADPDLRRDAGFDGRTTAVSSSSSRMFETIGVFEHFPVPGCPIRQIRTSDGLAPGSLTFDAGEGGEPLGWMHENRNLRAALRARTEAGRMITLRYTSSASTIERGEHGVTVTLDTGETVRAPLLVAAEGRLSPTREAAGIRVARWIFDHRAIVSS